MARVGNQSAETWVEAAYQRFASGGLAAVRVEVVARDILATKGSFYWHFANRQELVDAVTQRWEERETEALIRVADGESQDPADRLAALFEQVAAGAGNRKSERTLYVEAAREGVQETIARVTQRRIDYVTDLLTALGFEHSEAVQRAIISLAIAVGLQQFSEVSGPVATDGRTLTRTALKMVLAR